MNIRRKVLWFFLALTIATRIWSIVSLSQSSDRYYLPENLGRDVQAYSVNAWYAVREGKIPFTVGYGSVLLAGAPVQLFESTGMCHDALTCGDLVYVCLIVFGVSGLLWLNRKSALLFCAVFLLGVPMYRAIEAGNVDLFLSVLFGVILLIVASMQKTVKHRLSEELFLGVSLGFMLNVKAFLLPFVLISLISVPPTLALWASFAVSFSANALWPWAYGVHCGLFDVFLFARRDTLMFTKELYTQVNYGNNAVMPYVSNILQAFHAEKISLSFLAVATTALSAGIVLLIVVKPFFDEHVVSTMTVKKRIKITYPFLLVCYVLSYIGMLTLPAWSYDYRILYGIPLIGILLTLTKNPKTLRLLYLSIVSLLIKSLWIPKDRIMTVFLYIHLYFLLRAVLSYWRDHPLDRKNSSPLV
jgi:hypothetical protein